MSYFEDLCSGMLLRWSNDIRGGKKIDSEYLSTYLHVEKLNWVYDKETGFTVYDTSLIDNPGMPLEFIEWHKQYINMRDSFNTTPGIKYLELPYTVVGAHKCYHKLTSNGKTEWGNSTYIIISAEYEYIKDHILYKTTRYMWFKTIYLFLTWKDLPEVINKFSNHFYEVIRGDAPQKAKFDIDIPDAKLLKLHRLLPRVIEDLVKNIVRVANDWGVGDIALDKDIVITDSSKDIEFEDGVEYILHGNKASAHVILDRIFHKNNIEAKRFYTLVVAGMEPNHAQYVDPMVYSRNQNFRIVFNSKFGRYNIKMPVLEWVYYGQPITWIPRNTCMYHSTMITLGNDFTHDTTPKVFDDNTPRAIRVPAPIVPYTVALTPSPPKGLKFDLPQNVDKIPNMDNFTKVCRIQSVLRAPKVDLFSGVDIIPEIVEVVKPASDVGRTSFIVPAPTLKIKANVSSVQPNMDLDDACYAISMFTSKYPDMKGVYRIGESRDNYTYLTRKRGAYCHKCQRSHDNNNAWISMVLDKGRRKFFFGCYASSNDEIPCIYLGHHEDDVESSNKQLKECMNSITATKLELQKIKTIPDNQLSPDINSYRYLLDKMNRGTLTPSEVEELIRLNTVYSSTKKTITSSLP